MSLNIQKATEVAKTDGLTILLYAEAATGKTSFLGTLPGKVLVIDFEKGTMPLNKCKNVDIVRVKDDFSNWKDICEFVEGKNDYDWICLDSASDLYTHMMLRYGAAGKNDGVNSLQDYGRAYNKIKMYMRFFRDLRALGKNVVVTALETLINEQQSDGLTVNRVYPDLPHKITGDIVALFDIVARIEISEKKDSIGKRYLRLDKSPKIMAKNRLNNKKFCGATLAELIKEEK
jgi:phage nucleotide-binding protein